MTDETQSKPALPEPFVTVGLILGLALASVYYHVVMTTLPPSLWPLHFVALTPIVLIFLGVPTAFEVVYWQLAEERAP